MNIDQHLHRAAHRVRELDVDVPEFIPPRRPASRRATPVLAGLLVLGGAVSVVSQQAVPAAQGVQDVPAADGAIAPVAAAPERGTGGENGVATGPVMSVHDEISLIRSLGPDERANDAPAALTFRVPSGVS